MTSHGINPLLLMVTLQMQSQSPSVVSLLTSNLRPVYQPNKIPAPIIYYTTDPIYNINVDDNSWSNRSPEIGHTSYILKLNGLFD